MNNKNTMKPKVHKMQQRYEVLANIDAFKQNRDLENKDKRDMNAKAASAFAKPSRQVPPVVKIDLMYEEIKDNNQAVIDKLKEEIRAKDEEIENLKEGSIML